jgi:GNAT superfamily N-acetyltransferase
MTLMHPTSHLFCDSDFSARLESASAASSAEIATACAEVYPDSGACSIEIDGGVAAFAGVDSPLTQAFGLGFAGEVAPETFTRLEAFFLDRGAPVIIEVSPLAHPSMLALLGERGYRPVEHSNVLVLPLSTDLDVPSEAAAPSIREATPADEDAWVRAIGRGFAGSDEEAAAMEPIGRISFRSRGMRHFVAELDGDVVAAGSLGVHGGVASFAGAATLPPYRRLGAQTALYAHRIRYAARAGCDVATVSTSPGSGSQRNAERRGFRVVYTRTKWQLAGR